MFSILLEDGWKSLGSRATDPTQGTDFSRGGCFGLGKYSPEGEFTTSQGQPNPDVFLGSWPLVLPDRSGVHRRNTSRTRRRTISRPRGPRCVRPGKDDLSWPFSLGSACVPGHAFVELGTIRNADVSLLRRFRFPHARSTFSCPAAAFSSPYRAALFRTRRQNMPIMSAVE
jgi:hypothetical protein